MTRREHKPAIALTIGTTLIVIGVSFGMVGCEGDSAETIVREMGVNISGFYQHPAGGGVIQGNSGAPITYLNVRQSGDQIEAVDNNQNIFKGTASETAGGAILTIEGATTLGALGVLSGNISVSGTDGTLSGTWIEPDRIGTAYGKATVPGFATQPTTNTQTTVSLDPSNWTGCCSDHGGLDLTTDGKVQVNSSGFALCEDGTSSPSCNTSNRPN